MKRGRVALKMTLSLLLLSPMACAQKKEAPSTPTTAPAVSASKPETTAPAASGGTPDASALTNPSLATATAPETYAVKLETTKGDIIIDVTRASAPLGADRFYNLVKIGYYNDVAVFRVVSGFMAQLGISGDPKLNAIWREARITDDPVTLSNVRGAVSFATSGKDSRTTQFFINFVNNSRLDGMGFSPIGKVRDMAIVDELHSGYGEGAPGGAGPSQPLMQREGNVYLRRDFPLLDYIKKASIL